MRAVAVDLISQFGESAVFTRIEGGTFNPATGQTTGETTTEWTVNVTTVRIAEQSFDGVDVITGDIKLMLAAGEYKPKSNDKVTFNGATYKVVGVPASSRAQGLDITYEVQIRK
jgi:hypothetical protein